MTAAPREPIAMRKKLAVSLIANWTRPTMKLSHESSSHATLVHAANPRSGFLLLPIACHACRTFFLSLAAFFSAAPAFPVGLDAAAGGLFA